MWRESGGWAAGRGRVISAGAFSAIASARGYSPANLPQFNRIADTGTGEKGPWQNMAQPLLLLPSVRGTRFRVPPVGDLMKVCSLILALVSTLAACQQTSVPTASNRSPGIDPMSRNVSRTQGGSLRDPGSLNAPPIRTAPPAVASEGR